MKVILQCEGLEDIWFCMLGKDGGACFSVGGEAVGCRNDNML